MLERRGCPAGWPSTVTVTRNDLDADHGSHQRGLAATTRTEQADDLSDRRVVTDILRRHGPAVALAALLGTSGVLHLRRPGIFRPLIPRSLGDPDPWVLGSGVAELVCAAALVAPPTRRLGGWASAALLVGVFPGT